jgi:hypothetical protein
MTFKDVKATTWEEQYPKLCHVILEQFVYHKYLLDWKELPLHIFNCFNKILTDKAIKNDYEESLEYLSHALSLYHNRQVVILIDEYDKPILDQIEKPDLSPYEQAHTHLQERIKLLEDSLPTRREKIYNLFDRHVEQLNFIQHPPTFSRKDAV